MSDRLIIIKDPDGASHDPSLKWVVVDTMAAGMVVAYARTRAGAIEARKEVEKNLPNVRKRARRPSSGPFRQ